MKAKINIQPIPEERLKKGYPAYFYEEGYLFDSIEEILVGKNEGDVPDNITLRFESGKYKFPAKDASEFIFTYDNKIYPLIPSQWAECLDNDWYGDNDKELEFEINKEGFAEIIIRPIKLGKTERGFTLGEFKDDYDHNCTIQMSSVATRSCIWLGIDDPKPEIMASDAEKLGIPTDKKTGWIPYEIPKEVLFHTRMHLTREDVKKLLPLLTKFAETGRL